MSDVVVWGYSIPRDWLSQNETLYLSGLPKTLPSVEWVWHEMDRVWQSFGLDNLRSLDGQPVGEFYSHPVWLMNGIFTAAHPVSSGHRDSIARYVAQEQGETIADYGGGFGELALSIARHAPGAMVSIIEPFPSRVGIKRLKSESRINVCPVLVKDSYDFVIAQDVLEHVGDPIGLAGEIAGSVRVGGKVMFANCFYPVIMCHLPSTFYLRHTFVFVMKAMGLQYVGRVTGAEHALVFERVGAIDMESARRAEYFYRFAGPVLNFGRALQLSVARRVLSS
jgi:2-polyprenyl-6-hydroxyphenyl methylase/3-demethylubiquinone-9 3-methyltransferase